MNGSQNSEQDELLTMLEQMQDEITTCIALLHDVVEDTSVKMKELEKVFPPEVTEPLKLLTHDPYEDYFDYVRRIASDPRAKAVKLADLAHNMDESRIVDFSKIPESKLRSWRSKYAKALAILNGEE